jgi:small GTP-binding protein
LEIVVHLREENPNRMGSERNEGNKEYIFKVILIGDGAVGKTSLIRRYMEGKFRADYLPTIGSQIYTKKLVRKGETKITLVVWDISGQPAFTGIRPEYYKGATAILLVYDLTRPETFHHLDGWLNETKRYSSNPEIILIANKSDLEANRKINQKSGEEYASKINAPYLETSAKDGNNVPETFAILADRLVTTIPRSRTKK